MSRSLPLPFLIFNVCLSRIASCQRPTGVFQWNITSVHNLSLMNIKKNRRYKKYRKNHVSQCGFEKKHVKMYVCTGGI